MAKVELVGQLARSVELDMVAIQAAIGSGFADLQIIDSTLPAYDFEALEQDPTIVGVFVRRMVQKVEQERAANDIPRLKIAEKALLYGLLALEGQEIPIP